MVPNQCIDYLCFSATASPEDAEKFMIGSLISEKAALCGISNVWLLTDWTTASYRYFSSVVPLENSKDGDKI